MLGEKLTRKTKSVEQRPSMSLAVQRRNLLRWRLHQRLRCREKQCVHHVHLFAMVLGRVMDNEAPVLYARDDPR
jgi:hypothetical protein